MHDDIGAIAGFAHVDFQDIHAERQRPFDRRERILGQDAFVAFPVPGPVRRHQRVAVAGILVGSDDRLDRGAGEIGVHLAVTDRVEVLGHDRQPGILQLAAREIAGLDQPAGAVLQGCIGHDVVDIGAVEPLGAEDQRAISRGLAVDMQRVLPGADLLDRIGAVRDGGTAVAHHPAEGRVAVAGGQIGETEIIPGAGNAVGCVVPHIDQPAAAIGHGARGGELGAVLGAGDQQNAVLDAVHPVDLHEEGVIVLLFHMDGIRALAAGRDLGAVALDPCADVALEIEIRGRDIGVVFAPAGVIERDEDRVVGAVAHGRRAVFHVVAIAPVGAVLRDRRDEDAPDEVVRRPAGAHVVVAAVGIVDAVVIQRKELGMPGQLDGHVVAVGRGGGLRGGDVAGVDLGLIEGNEGEIEGAALNGRVGGGHACLLRMAW